MKNVSSTLLAGLWMLFATSGCTTDPGTADDDDTVDDDTADDDAGDDDTSDDDDTTEPLTDPGLPGSHDWSSGTDEVVVPGDGTELPLTVYLPDGQGPFPVVVFTHGFQLSPEHYATWGQHLASWGYIVVMPLMPGSLWSAPTHTEVKIYLDAVLDWVDLNGGVLAGRADPDRLGVSGHSMGGKISLLLAAEDGRPKASFTVDPVDEAGGPGGGDPQDYPSVTPELMPQIDIPLGFVGETTNASGGMMGQDCAPADNNFQQYFLFADSPAIQIEVLGANHMSFLDDPDCGLPCLACPEGTDDQAVTRQLSQKYMTAFYNIHLAGRPGYAIYLTGEPMDADVAAGLVTWETANGF